MNKIYRQKGNEGRWTIDFKVLQQIYKENVKISQNWTLGLEEIEQVILALSELRYLELHDKNFELQKYCTANGDYEESCWLDIGRPDLCWIDNQPQIKEDCEYWEEME